MEEAKPNATDPVQTEGGKDGKPDEVLALLNETLKREFKTREEALKSVDNLHRMVGDQAVAELREKAKDADLFSKVVSRYAKDEGVSNEDARKAILEITMDTQPEEKKSEAAPEKVQTSSATEARLEQALVKLQERDLLEAYPEAKLVLADLKALRSISPAKELKEIYEGSGLKDVATKASIFEKEKAQKETTAVESKTRQVNMEDASIKQLAQKAVQSGIEQDKVALVEAYFKNL
jgi:hypothetical protein